MQTPLIAIGYELVAEGGASDIDVSSYVRAGHGYTSSSRMDKSTAKQITVSNPTQLVIKSTTLLQLQKASANPISPLFLPINPKLPASSRGDPDKESQ